MSDYCNNCYYWSAKGTNAKRGDCQRHPPKGRSFPKTLALDWCGEHKGYWTREQWDMVNIKYGSSEVRKEAMERSALELAEDLKSKKTKLPNGATYYDLALWFVKMWIADGCPADGPSYEKMNESAATRRIKQLVKIATKL